MDIVSQADIPLVLFFFFFLSQQYMLKIMPCMENDRKLRQMNIVSCGHMLWLSAGQYLYI